MKNVDPTPDVDFMDDDELAAELERRYAEHLRNPEASISWEDLRDREPPAGPRSPLAPR